MWTVISMGFIIFMLNLVSPFIGALALIMFSLMIATGAGVVNLSWMFFSILIIYMGGVMVLFIYLMSLISQSKIKINSMPLLLWSIIFFSIVSLVLKSFVFSSFSSSSGVGLTDGYLEMNTILVTLFILYLLLGLVVVLVVCQKIEGPMKNQL